MIPIIKGPEPESLTKARQETKKNLAIHKKHQNKTEVRSSKKKGQSKSSHVIYITSAYREDGVKVALVDSHFGKCAYCETYILHTSHGDVEHFRPKSEYSGDPGEETARGYFWLAYDWNNLFLACPICNETFKHTYFALMPEVEGLLDGSDRMSPGDSVDGTTEKPVLIDPERENPRALLEFDPFTTQLRAIESLDGVPSTTFAVDAARAGKNILHLGLNRGDLVAARHRHRAFLRGMFALVAQAAPMDPVLQEQLVTLCKAVVALKKTYDGGQARDIHQQLQSWCEPRYRAPYQASGLGPLVDNAREAMKWLLFCTTARAEYSALSQDLLVAWTQELVQAVTTRNQVPSSTFPGTSQTPPTQGTNTVSTSLPVLWVPSVLEHLDALERARLAYAKRREDMAQDLLEALRQESANEFNALITEFNAFQKPKAFDATKAFDVYDTWAVDLEHINEAFELLGSEKKLEGREEFLQFLQSHLEAHTFASLYALDQRLKHLWSHYETSVVTHGIQANEAWRLEKQVLLRGTELLQALSEAIPKCPPTVLQSSGSMDTAHDAFPMPQELAWLKQRAVDIAGISPRAMQELYARLLQQHEAVARTYSQLDTDRRRTADTLTRDTGLQTALEHLARDLRALKNLPDVKVLLLLVRDGLNECDSLLSAYLDLHVSRSTWRCIALDAMRNDLLDIEAKSLHQEDWVISVLGTRATPPQPTFEDPYQDTPTPHTFTRQRPVKLRITTAYSQLEDYQEQLRTGKRAKPTKPQQAKLERLVQAETRVRELVATWRKNEETRLHIEA
ncbi:hypothetical protein ACLEPN_18925 [Myxococcus sp. 1LA]